MQTTLNAIKEEWLYGLYAGDYLALLAHLGKTTPDDEPLLITTILDASGLTDALYCMHSAMCYDKQLRTFAVWCARQVQHSIIHPENLWVLQSAERFVNGWDTAMYMHGTYKEATHSANLHGLSQADLAALYTAHPSALKAAQSASQAAVDYHHTAQRHDIHTQQIAFLRKLCKSSALHS